MIAQALALPLGIAGEEEGSGRRAPKKPMDEAQFETFYRKTAGGLWSYVFRLTGDPAVSDDLLQKAFFRFLRSSPQLESEEHLRRYLYKTATNLAFDHFRESKRNRETSTDMKDHASPAVRNDLRHDMARAFEELKPRERAMLWLAHVEGADHNEISEALGVKSKSVRVLLFRARKRLAEVLAQRGIGPEVVR